MTSLISCTSVLFAFSDLQQGRVSELGFRPLGMIIVM